MHDVCRAVAGVRKGIAANPCRSRRDKEVGKHPRAKRTPKGADDEATLRKLQIELVKAERHIIRRGHKVLVIFEGRDASGKDGTIKRIVEHLSPRETRVVALGKPTERDNASWYFQRYVAHLPAAQEMVLFNRSWYNRAGVERVMGFCTKKEYKTFSETVVPFEHMLVGAGIRIIKYYLDISRKEQQRRLRERRRDPLKQWKISPIDEAALTHWDAYSQARDEMLTFSSSSLAPWFIVRADDKQSARLNVIRDLLSRLACPETNKHLATPNPEIVFQYDAGCAEGRLLAA
jgi:polyphosphate kinase 2